LSGTELFSQKNQGWDGDGGLDKMASYVEQLANGSFYDYVMKETVRCAVNVNNERDSMLTADKVRAFCCRRVIVSRHQNCCSRSEVEDLGLEILNKAVSRNGCKKLKKYDTR
jgi:hypothetical protein